MYRAFEPTASESAANAIAAADGAATKLAAALDNDDEHVADAMSSYQEGLLCRFTHGSAAIEGSTLSLMETRLVIDGEFLPNDDQQLHDMFSAMGVRDGYEYARSQLLGGRRVDAGFVCDVHERTALDLQPRLRGSYRTVPVVVRGSLLTPPDPLEIRQLMESLVYHHEASKAPALARIAVFHVCLEAIHPFRDGNGRAGRNVLNGMLESSGYPPVAIKAHDRERYLSSLEEWQTEDEPQAFMALLAEAVEEEARARLEMVKSTVRAARELGER